QHDRSNVAIGGMTLHNGVTRNEYRVTIIGDECECHLDGMAVASGSQHIDNSSDVRHAACRSTSRQLFKYVLDDQSTGAFEGSIVVEPGARFTEASQTDRNILASRGARMHTKPQLLIYNDDVKCSHGATTGQLDDRALFYMQSRGIPREEARMMLMQAFMTEVVDTVRVESVRDRLRHLVERRLAGYDAHCNDCGAKNEDCVR
ncbi:MAG: SufD family Fe-S cluster assembly protein, partial [Muribaculaceae bacterium]|nr:SufD family Fe-S cluster assembly protein [Muribaculaceae bacterium]